MLGYIKNVILIAAALYIGVLAFLTYYQRSMLYLPQAGGYKTPLEAGVKLPFEELEVKTEDNLFLKGWYAAPTRKSLTIVFFHGNADNLQGVANIAVPYIEKGYGFLAVEYRGYSGLHGSPDENGLYADGRAYVAKLVDMGTGVDSIVMMGHSLGTGVATQIAREFHAGGLVLLSPFRSVPKMAAKLYPYFPAQYLVFDEFANDEKLPDMQVPLLIVHGEDDTNIPFIQGQQLFEMAQEPKQFEPLSRRGHNDLFEDAAPVVLDWLGVLGKADH